MTLRSRIRGWVNDLLLRKLAKDSSQLLAGSIAEVGLSFVAVILAARGLGPEEFGTLVLVQTYVILVDELINFQSWQALIKYGAESLESGNSTDFKKLAKFGTVLDASTALIGTSLVITAALGLRTWTGWSEQFTYMLLAYSAFIAFNLTGTPTAVLRLFDRFDLLAVQKGGVGAVKITAVGIAFVNDMGIWGYLCAWLLTDILSHTALLALGWRELRREGFGDTFRVPLGGITSIYPGLWRYVWSTNVHGTVKKSARRVDVVIVGAVLGAAAVGLYEVVKKFAKGLAQLTSPLGQAIYPELAKLWTRDEPDRFARLGIRSAILAGGAALFFWIVVGLAGTGLLEVVFGDEYVAAYPLLLWYLFGSVIAVAGFPLSPGMLAMGRPGTNLLVELGATLLYLGSLGVLIQATGLVGAGMAYVGYYIVWTGVMIAVGYRAWKGV